jgi:hypothetical protein
VAGSHSHNLQFAAESNSQNVSYTAWGFISIYHNRVGVFLSQRSFGISGMERSLISPKARGSNHFAVIYCPKPGTQKQKSGCGSPSDFANLKYAVFL